MKVWMGGLYRAFAGFWQALLPLSMGEEQRSSHRLCLLPPTSLLYQSAVVYN